MVTSKPGPTGALPWAGSPWSSKRWLVIAPHPDDETLGAGALIRETAANGRLAGVAYLTDGAGSHAHPDARSRARLVALRQAEARSALRRLCGARTTPPVFLGWPDASPPEERDARFGDTARRLAWLCRQRRVDAIAVTAASEPHCDHAAAAALARAVAARALRPVAVFDYLVWGEAPPEARFRLSTPTLSGGLRRRALSAHRTQRTPLFGDGFRLEDDGDLRTAADRLYRRAS